MAYLKLDGDKYLDTRPICLRNKYSYVLLENNQEIEELPIHCHCTFYSYGLCNSKGECNQQHFRVILAKDLPESAKMSA